MALLIRSLVPIVQVFKTTMVSVFLLGFLGCVDAQHQPIQLGSPGISPPKKEFIVMRNFQTSWNALVRALDGSPERTIKRQNKKTGTITLQPATIMVQANCDCGKLGDVSLTGSGHRYTRIRLEKQAPQETLLIIHCDYSTTHYWKDIHGKVVRRERITCVSNGRFERELYQRVLGFMSP